MKYSWKRNTAIFLSGQAVSLFGSSLVQYAITWHIMLTTKSGFYTMLSILCGFLPTLILSPFAGVWADRYSRKTLIILADAGIAVATLILAILWMNGVQSIELLLAIMVVRSLGGAVQQPSVNAMLPSIVPTEHLTRVNGINGSLQSMITLISPMVSGALIGLAAMSSIFFIDVITAAAAIAVLLAFFKLPASDKPAAPEAEGEGYFAQMKAGISYIKKTPFLVAFFVLGIGLWTMTSPVAFLTPLKIARSFGDEVWRLTAMEVGFSLGMLLGGLIISAWGGLKNRIHTVGIAGLLLSLSACVLGISQSFWPYIVIMALTGIVLPIFNTPMIVILQEKVDPQYLGRVFSVMTMLASSAMPLSMLLFGPLADVVSIDILLIVSGLIMAVFNVLMLSNKPLAEAGRRA